MADDKCQGYRDFIAFLQEQLAQEQQALQQAQQEGIKADPILRTIHSLRDELRAASVGLENCLHPAPPPPPPPAQTSNLTIVAVEETQSIQYWSPPPAQGSGFRPSNSIPMIANKQTILRVYINAGADNRFPLPGPITGTIYLARSPGLAPFQLTPINGPIQPLAIVNIERGEINHTLNFVIPSVDCVGTARAYITVFDAAHPGDPTFTSLQFISEDLYFNPTPALQLHGVLVHYTGLDYFGKKVDVTASGLDFAYTIESYLHRCYPVADINYTGCEVLEWSEQISKDQGIHDLKGKIEELRATSGTTDIYVGYYPEEAGCGGVCGLGGGGSALTKAGDGPEAAHEIGHALGLDHIPCPNMSAANSVSDFPAYNGFPLGSIGEFGLDTVAMRVFDPNMFSDFLSYCPPYWISPYNYLKLWNAIRSQYGTATALLSASTQSLHLGLRVHRDDRVEVLWAWQLTGPTPGARVGSASAFVLELVDTEGRLIDCHRCGLDGHLDRDRPFTDLFESIRFAVDLSEVRVVRDGRVLRSLKVAAIEPTVAIESLDGSERDPHLVRLRWTGGAPKESDPPLTYAVRYSHNGGKNWRTLAAGISVTHYAVNLDILPGGDESVIQVLASAGLRTALASSEHFQVRRKPRRAHIIAPKQNGRFVAGEPIALAGTGYSADFGTTRDGEAAWSTPTLGRLGAGLRAIVRDLPVGEHRITLHVADGLGGESCDTTSINIVSDRHETPEPR